jgi:Bacterial PH domain
LVDAIREMSSANGPGHETLQFGVSPRGRLVTRVLIAVVALVTLWLAAATAFLAKGPFDLRVLLVVAFMLITVVVVVGLERRMVRSTVTADPSGLRIDNGLGTHFVAWSDVEGFVADLNRPFLVDVERTDGPPIPMAGIRPTPFGKQRGPVWDSIHQLETYRRRMIPNPSEER